MPYKDPVGQREYQRVWIADRREQWLDGKACVDCGATERLELDHVDPASKVHHAVWTWSETRREAELAKCEVRCRPCHQERHAALLRRHGIGRYGKGCRCEACRAAKARANAQYRQRVGERRRRESNARERLCRPLPNHSATAPGEAPYPLNRAAA